VRRAALSLLLAVWATTARADEPLPLPERHEVCTSGRRFCAESDPKSAVTSVFATADRRRPLWTIPGWHRYLWISEDGQTLVTGYPGGNLLSRDYQPGDALVTFHRHGPALRQVVVRTVTVAELIADRSKLRRTASHYLWGDLIGWEGERFCVKTVEREVCIDSRTGDKGPPRPR
jgi:hypothetical protein